jgi:hypothetical protein
VAIIYPSELVHRRSATSPPAAPGSTGARLSGMTTADGGHLEEYRRRVRAAYETGRLDDISGEAVMAAWTGSSYPEAIYGSDFCVRAFRHTYECFSLSTGYEPLTVFRGTVPLHERGMAWTTDPSWACRFAWGRLHRHNPGTGVERPTLAFVYKTHVERAAILCEVDQNHLLSGRHYECEVIVDPERIGKVETFRTVRPGASETYDG